MEENSTGGKRLPYFASSVATPSSLSGGSEITNALSQDYERACYKNKFELGGEPGKLILDRVDRLEPVETNRTHEAERQRRQREKLAQRQPLLNEFK